MIEIQGGIRIRHAIWFEAWCSTVRADNCEKITTPTTYADRCLEDFDKRFPEHLKQEQKEKETRTALDDIRSRS